MRYFFFQAEDGIRDHCVTGVQTCALPILIWRTCGSLRADELLSEPQVRQIMEYYLAVRMRRYGRTFQPTETSSHADRRSEERRVGKESRSREVREAGEESGRLCRT